MGKFEWNGFQGVRFEFEGLPAQVIFPNGEKNGRWALKTEYADAFPETEIELFKRGWCIAFNRNYNRWASDKDLDRKCKFIDYVAKTFSLDKKCSIVGMSCGGMYGIKVAAICPERIQALYLDAPVVNLLSCPLALGDSKAPLFEEFYGFTGMTISQMLSYREHPLDKLPILAENKIPVVLVAGDNDETVPYHENGALVEDYYRKRGLQIVVHIKQGCGHHPHGLENVKIIADEIEACYSSIKVVQDGE